MEGAGGAEKDIFPAALPHPVEQIAGEHRGGAAAARAAAVDVLIFQIEDHQTAVVVVGGQVHPVLPEQLQQQLTPQLAQVAGDDQVVVVRPPAGILKVGGEGGIGRRAMAAPMLLVSVIPLSVILPRVQWVT